MARSRIASVARWTAFVVGVTTIVVLVAFTGLYILFTNAFRECLGPDHVSAESVRSEVTLDAQRPVAEQLVTVRIAGAGLPPDVPADGALITVERDPSAAGANGPMESSTSADIESTFIRVDTGSPVARVVPAGERYRPTGYPSANSAPLECPLGSDCERTYRVVIALADPAPAQPVGVR